MSSTPTATSRANRLRRSLRSPGQQQQPPPPPYKYCDTAHLLQNKHGMSSPPPLGFKTPTRLPRSKYSSPLCGESPNNDGEFQQDIVWDATTPSPVRGGKRGKSRRAAAAIGISEIVRRIAPMHGRPEVVEPTLQKWIGDNAAIPPTGVDDLMKLAKQFDFNMFQRDEEQAEDMHQQTLELLSEDILEYENGIQDGPQQPVVEPSPPDAPENAPPAPEEAPPAPEEAPPAPEDGPPAGVVQAHSMDDDLDLLFDEPTQRISGNFSLNGSLGPMETSICNPTAARPPACCPTPAGVRLNDDDWENDDFLNDSVVIEMTQNPLSFAPPQHCSTQRGSEGTQDGGRYPSIGPPGTPGGLRGVAKTEPRMLKNRATFKLEANPEFALTNVVTAVARNQTSVSSTGPQMAFSTPHSQALPSRERPVVKPWQPSGGAVSKPPPAWPAQPQTSHANVSGKRNSAATTPVAWNAMKENQPTRSSNIPLPPPVKEHQTLSTSLASDHFLADEDLDQLFSSEPVWDDDGDDDDLLCQMCEDLESQGLEVEAGRPAGVHRKVPLEVNVLKQASPAKPPTDCQAAGRLCSLPDSFAGNARSGVMAARVQSSGYAPPEQNRYGGSDAGRSQCYGRGAAPKPWAGDEGRFPFKKPLSPSFKAVHTGPEKCSMAEIERKKLQALERRRQRLQASQSLRAQP
ncbi:hypothetical protein CRUP_026475 [Coryphaenoides rupestris]|nr:hypothetical protein CRUP_026475 [Coryphaenoides rupestris]